MLHQCGVATTVVVGHTFSANRVQYHIDEYNHIGPYCIAQADVEKPLVAVAKYYCLYIGLKLLCRKVRH
jgi:hypothetical protein